MFEKMSSNLVALLYSSLNVQGLDRSKERALVSNGLCKSAQHQATKTMNGARAIVRRAYPRRSRCAPRVPRPPPTHSDVAAVCPIGLRARKRTSWSTPRLTGSRELPPSKRRHAYDFIIIFNESKTVENIVCPRSVSATYHTARENRGPYTRARQSRPGGPSEGGLSRTTRDNTHVVPLPAPGGQIYDVSPTTRPPARRQSGTRDDARTTCRFSEHLPDEFGEHTHIIEAIIERIL